MSHIDLQQQRRPAGLLLSARLVGDINRRLRGPCCRRRRSAANAGSVMLRTDREDSTQTCYWMRTILFSLFLTRAVIALLNFPRKMNVRAAGYTVDYVDVVNVQLVGRPYLPPYWSLGFQLCRYGYNSLDKLKAAVDRTRIAGVPQV